MPLVNIADLDDPRLAPYRALKQTNDTARRGLFIAEGGKLVERLLRSTLVLESVLLSEPHVAQFTPLLPPELPAFVIADDAVDALVGFNFHRGILACGRRPAPPALETVVAGPKSTLVICPDVQDPENLGAIVRIAAGFGAAGLMLGPHCADPFSRRVQRVSMGNVYQLPIVPVDDIVAALAELRIRHAMPSWATVLDSDAEVFDPAARPGSPARPDRLAIVFGSEGHGIPREIINACDRRVTIPMPSGVDSLNVAVAAGIFLYELTRKA
ncbi:MAG: RNA methyltransferase [Pirellula sp.]|nr:RNA methyltransferase [Pirellula sp.]